MTDPDLSRRLEGLVSLIRSDWGNNRFYSAKLRGMSPETLLEQEGFRRLPFTRKAELIEDQHFHPPYGSNLNSPVSGCSRIHQTSGTTSNQPLRRLDSPTSWSVVLDCWDAIFELAGVTTSDRLFFPFSFGPFLGFWSSFESAARDGKTVLSGGGMSTLARLKFMTENAATVVCCTPTYALHMAEAAQHEGIDLGANDVKAIITAGEPGGSISGVRLRIESAWSARVFDHYGLTEVGPVAAECVENPGNMHILEHLYLAEVIDPATGTLVPEGAEGELVLTTLGRVTSPLLRYRTGDMVRTQRGLCACGRDGLRLEGGVRGRVDDMIVVRGQNIYPSAIESILRRYPEIAEYRITVDRGGALVQLHVEIEPFERADDRLADIASNAIQDELLLRAAVTVVPKGTLPRFEMKSRRVIDKTVSSPPSQSGVPQR